MHRLIGLLLCLILSSACLAPAGVRNVSSEERRWLLSGEALAGGSAGELSVPDDRVLDLDRDMREFAEAAVRGHQGRERVSALLGAILYPSGLDLKYDARASFTAIETFRQRRANCLSFTHLFVAMARHVGLDAEYNEVDVPPLWDLRQSNTLVLNKHVNAVITRPGRIRHVIDLNVAEYEVHYRQEPISDRLALAQHYNNRAMAYLVADEYPDALRYLVKAVELEPGVSYLWNNLGSLYRRAGNLRAAELAYRIALSEDAGDLMAISNVARLYDELGNAELSSYYEKKAHNFRLRNPYFLYGMAQQAFIDRDYELAKQHVLRAIHRYSGEHRFYFLLGAIYHQLGEARLADVNLSRAVELSDDGEQNARYRQKIDRLQRINS